MSMSYTAGRYKAFDDNGAPLAGGRLYTYASGTTTFQAAYTTSALTTPCTYTPDGLGGQYILLDARGEAEVWLGALIYTLTLRTALGGVIFSQDSVSDIALSLQNNLADTGPDQGDNLVGSDDGLSGARWTNVRGALEWLKNRSVNSVSFFATGNDDTNALQAFINAHKGENIIVCGDCTFAGVILDGPTYNGTKLTVLSHKLKARSLGGSPLFGNAWVGLVFKDVEDWELDYSGDGQRLLQPQIEQTHLVGAAGGKNFRIHNFFAKEIRGDGLYISQSSWTSNSATPENMYIGNISGVNSANDGRNLLSIIACKKAVINNLSSISIGGVINGFLQPGGVDIEPNFDYQPCEDISFGKVFVRGIGTSNVGVSGKVMSGFPGTYCVNRVTFSDIDSLNTNVLATDGVCAANFQKASRVYARGVVSMVDYVGTAMSLNDCIDMDVNMTIPLAKYGATIGFDVLVDSSYLTFRVKKFSAIGVRTINLSNSTVAGKVEGALTGNSTFCVQMRNAGDAVTQTNVTYAVNVPFNSNSRGYRNEAATPVTFVNCRIINCDVSGYTFATGIDNCHIGMAWQNIFGYETAAAMPTAGSFPAGHFVRRSNPAKDINNMSVMGWHRATTGAAHVAETDWFTARVSLVSPAA